MRVKSALPMVWKGFMEPTLIRMFFAPLKAITEPSSSTIQTEHGTALVWLPGSGIRIWIRIEIKSWIRIRPTDPWVKRELWVMLQKGFFSINRSSNQIKIQYLKTFCAHERNSKRNFMTFRKISFSWDCPFYQPGWVRIGSDELPEEKGVCAHDKKLKLHDIQKSFSWDSPFNRPVMGCLKRRARKPRTRSSPRTRPIVSDFLS